jgi:hypothetical protein
MRSAERFGISDVRFDSALRASITPRTAPNGHWRAVGAACGAVSTAAKNFFAAEGFAGVVAVSPARKTRESAPLIRSRAAASDAFGGRRGRLQHRRKPNLKRAARME